MRILPSLVLLSALAIAACAAFFSIVGLKLLFVGGGLSIVVMGTALEVGKLVTATFLKQKWNEISGWMRTYMVAATLFLVGITSIGIYGFLSAGYNATSVAVQGYERQIDSNTLKIGELAKEITSLKSDIYNEPEIAAVNDIRKSFSDQRLQLIKERNAQVENIRKTADTTKDTVGDVTAAKQALELAKASLDSDTRNEIDQIKLYSARLEILDKEVQKWLDEGRGNIFRKGGLDRARETKAAQKSECDEIDGQIKRSQDRIDKLREQHAIQVKEYNDRVVAIDARTKVQRAEVDDSIKRLEKENAATMSEIAAYNKEADDKIAALNLRKGESVTQNKTKVAQNQSDIQALNTQNDELRDKMVHTDVGTFKFIAKSLNIPLDKAVNWFIWVIMLVFDPLAVCLILAFNVMVGKSTKENVVQKAPKHTSQAAPHAVVSPITADVTIEKAPSVEQPSGDKMLVPLPPPPFPNIQHPPHTSRHA